MQSLDIRATVGLIVPFVATFIAYFILRLPETKSDTTVAYVKALPVLIAIWIAWFQSCLVGNNSFYNWNIVLGLFFGVLGDIFLVVPFGASLAGWTFGGALFFGIGHIFYIRAFKLMPFGPLYILIFYVLYLLILLTITATPPGLVALTNGLYGLLEAVMVWRATVRFTEAFSNSATFPWRKLWGALGGFIFLVSDSWLVYIKFTAPLVIWRELVMINYYSAQLLFALSVPQPDDPDPAEPREARKQE